MRSVSDLLRADFIDQRKSWQKIHNFPRKNSRTYFYLNYATPDFLLFVRKIENNAAEILSICSERGDCQLQKRVNVSAALESFKLNVLSSFELFRARFALRSPAL